MEPYLEVLDGDHGRAGGKIDVERDAVAAVVGQHAGGERWPRRHDQVVRERGVKAGGGGARKLQHLRNDAGHQPRGLRGSVGKRPASQTLPRVDQVQPS